MMLKKLFLLLALTLLISCAPKIVYVPVETVIRTEIHDTIDSVRLVPVFIKIQTKDTISNLENSYAFSSAMWSNGYLTHSLGIKPVAVPVVVPVTTIYKDKTTTVNLLTDDQKMKVEAYNGLIKDNDKLKASSKSKGSTIWKLIGLLSLSVIALFRKPIWLLLSKLVKPI